MICMTKVEMLQIQHVACNVEGDDLPSADRRNLIAAGIARHEQAAIHRALALTYEMIALRDIFDLQRKAQNGLSV
jgi:hypothetical protein